jgi:pseudouridine-5'-monophosphatase
MNSKIITPRTITHVIFDMDGLLLDTERFYTEVTQAIVGRFGKTFDWSIKSHMIGLPSLKAAQYLVDTLSLPITAEQYLNERKSMLENRFPDAKPLPGAERLTQHLHAHGIPQAVASSSDRRFFELKTTHHQQWFNTFDCVVLGDNPDVHQGKPAPDIFVAAARCMKAEPENCLVFEDAPSGMQAALAAGMSVAVVPDPHMAQEAYARAHLILKSLTEFEPENWGLPPF